MSPDAPDVDVSVGGRTVLEDVSFGDVSEYLTVPAGRHQVRVTEAGNASNVVYEDTVALEGGAYTLSAVGETGSNTPMQSDVALFEDGTSPSANNSSVRLAHVSPDAGPVDVTINDTGEVLFDNATFGNTTEYAQVPAGNYTLDVRRASANNDGRIIDSFDLRTTSGTAYTVFTAGYVTSGDEPVGVLFEPITVTDGLNATVRFAHMSPDAPSVDVSVNGRPVERALSYSATTEYFEVPAGNRTVTITAANASEPLYEESIALNASTNYTVVVAGETTSNGRPFDPVMLNDDADPNRTNVSSANVRLLHAAPDAPPVDVTVNATGQVLFDGVAYGNASNYTTVPGGNYTFEAFVATPDNTGDDIATFADQELPGGASYTLFLSGYVSPGDEPASTEIELIVANDTDDYVDRDTLD